MTSRKIPPTLSRSVRTMLQKERDSLVSEPRGRGRAGLQKDRKLEYLTLMLEGTGVAEGTLPEEASEGRLVTMRHAGDAQHRTYRLTEERGTSVELNLPPSWALGRAVLGRREGEQVTYEHAGTTFAFTVIAVWDDDGAAEELPQGSEEQVRQKQSEAPSKGRRRGK